MTTSMTQVYVQIRVTRHPLHAQSPRHSQAKIRHKRSSPRGTEKPDIANHSEIRIDFVAKTQSLSQEEAEEKYDVRQIPTSIIHP